MGNHHVLKIFTEESLHADGGIIDNHIKQSLPYFDARLDHAIHLTLIGHGWSHVV